MASSPLNAEPSQPQEREEQHLPPKTYVDAAVENLTGDSEKDNNTPSQYIGQGEDDAPRSPLRKPHKRNGSLRVNGLRNKTSAQSLLVEKFRDRDGEHLTSINPLDSEDSGQQTQKSPSRRTGGGELVSGRRAGAGWEKSGCVSSLPSHTPDRIDKVRIHWAPLNVPLKRRLQTLVVLWHTLCIALFLTTFFFLCAVPLFWPLLFPYVLYLLFSTAGHSGTLSRRSSFLRSLSIWSLFASYFPARLHRSQVLPPTRKYIFGYHPHGIISHGAFAAFVTEALGFAQLFPGITNTLLTLDSNFRIPLYRDYALALGLASVSRESCENILSKGGANGEGMGRAITIVVGGARESLDAQPGTLRLVLKRRKGFVKLGIRTGADLVPVLAFGENNLYDQVQPETHPVIHKTQLVVKKALGFTIPLFHARGVFNYDVGMMPYRTPLNIVVGRPIKVAQQKVPDEAYVDEIHGLYVAELERLWREWRGEFAKGMKADLEFVE
ncbi:diacylglycerol O-acyltransferase 1 [Xylographa pallens]|nr:diacylglycerol O-acyltransferase 1 [Xylographa pallens]